MWPFHADGLVLRTLFADGLFAAAQKQSICDFFVFFFFY